MKRLLLTTSLIVPFLVGSAFAQDAPATPDPADPLVGEQSEPLADDGMGMD